MNATILRPPLYLITDRHQTRNRPLTQVIGEAIAGGARYIQLREKDLPPRELLSLAQQMRRLTTKGSARLLINDRMDICLAAEADGVHLRSSSLPTAVVRKVLGESRLIGVSAHSLEEAQQAQDGGANFIVLGPIYETSSKIPYGPPLGLDGLKAVRKRIRIPILALGGIKRERVREVLGAGADGIALISAILTAQDPRQATLDLIRELEQNPTKRSAHCLSR